MNKNCYWRWGQTNPVYVEIGSTVTVNEGDLLYLLNGVVKPVSELNNETGWSGTLIGDRKFFAENFLGIACQSKPSGVERKIRVATTGVFSISCTSATYNFGALVGVVQNSALTAFENDKVGTVSDVHQAIGRVVRKESTSVSSVQVEIVSSVMYGGLPYCKCTTGEAAASSSSSGAVSGT